MIHIGKTIRIAHEQVGMRHKAVADMIDCHSSNYSHTLAQGNITVHRYKQICDALGLTMDQVYKIGEQHANG